MSAGFVRYFFCRFVIAVSDHDVGPALRRQQRNLAANSAAAAHNQNHLAAQFFLRRLASNLGFLQLPVFDAEGFRRRQSYIVRMHGEGAGRGRGTRLGEGLGRGSSVQRGCAFHDMDCVYVELAGEAGFGFALAKTEHADAGNQNHGGIGIADGRRIRLGERVVVLRILLAIILQRGINLLAQALQARCPAARERTGAGPWCG